MIFNWKVMVWGSADANGSINRECSMSLSDSKAGANNQSIGQSIN